MSEILRMIEETAQWRKFHKARGSIGYLEALACSIRLKALEDALEAVERDK